MNIFPLGGVQGVQHPYCTKCTVVFAASLARPQAEKSFPKRVFYDTALLYVKFQLFSSNSFGDMGVPNLHYGALRPWDGPLRKIFTPKTSI